MKNAVLPVLALGVSVLLGGAGLLRAQESPHDLRLEALLEEVLARTPRLSAVDAARMAVSARVAVASTLPDPTFQIGAMNVGLPDFETDMAMSMVPALQLMQTVPWPGKLALRGRVAEATEAMASEAVRELHWQIRGETAELFYQLYALDRRIEVMSETLDFLRDFQAIARALYAAGTGPQADVLRADVEVARIDGDIRTLVARRRALAARVNGLRDRVPGTDLGRPVLGSLPTRTPPFEVLAGWARDDRPALARLEHAVTQAERRVDLAEKQIWPDLTLGLGYGQRDRGEGTERMGSLTLGFTLPIHAGSRQLAERDEARALRRMAEAQLQNLFLEVDARIEELLAELDRDRTLIALYRDEIIPAAIAGVESALSSYRVGEVDFMTLLDAQMSVNGFEIELYQLYADYGRTLAHLESTVGRTLPYEEFLDVEELHPHEHHIGNGSTGARSEGPEIR